MADTIEQKFEVYIRQLGKDLKGIDKVILTEEFWKEYTTGSFQGALLLIHRPQWRGNNLRDPHSEKRYTAGITVLKCIPDIKDYEGYSKVVSDCGELAEQIVAKMIVDSMTRTKLVNNRMVAVDHFIKYIGDDVSANPVKPKDLETIAGIQVDFSFRTLSGIKINEDLWQ